MKGKGWFDGLLFGLICLMALSITASCSGTPATAVYREAVSAEKRERNPDVKRDELAEIVSGNTRFAIDLYRHLHNEDGNLIFSPFSISQALGMTYAGARGNTEAQIKETLHFTLPQERLHPAFNSLDLRLASRSERAKEIGGGKVRLNIANSLWGQMGEHFLDDFLEILAKNYGGGLNLVDFINDPEGCRQVINGWAEEKTEGRIKNLIPPNVIDKATRLVLVNAIYFNAAWQYPFKKKNTRDETFHPLEGSPIYVPMMHMDETKPLGYMAGEGYQAAELPYDGQELSMVILLPDSGNYWNFEESLDFDFLDDTIDSLEPRDVIIVMPKAEYETAFNLSQTLIDMGMPDAFGGSPDFSGMDGTYELFIQAVIHKAFIAITEEGTEAAAATGVALGKEVAMWGEEPIEFVVDRPYIFLIRDVETGAILFLGRVLNPAA